jgi:hypothetical protein
MPTCLKIVLNYASDVLGIQQRKIRLGTIAKTIGATPVMGTTLGSVEFINSRLDESHPPMKFKRQLSGTYDEIKTEIDEDRPVIAWIDKRQIVDDEVWHSVVINGYDEDLRRIYYCDPALSEEYWQKESESGDFIMNKLSPQGHLVKLIIGGKGQQTLINVDQNGEVSIQ